MITEVSTGNLTLNERYFDELLMQNGKLHRLQHADGFINLSQNGTPVEYFYYLKDHLGNVRATLTNSSLNGLTIHQTNDYYPFGMSYTPRQTGMQDSNWENKYKYNGKEEQEVPGGWLDFHARFYDPAIVRTTTQDPHAENYYSESSYSFMGNNPIINIDPTGMDWFYYKKKHGNDATYHWHDGSTHALSFTYIDSDGNEQNENIELQGTKSAIVDEIKKNPGEPNSGNNDEELAEIETNGEVSENPAKKVYEGGMAIALTLSLADGPQPGPGDAAGISYAASTIVTAGLVWLGWEIYQFAEHSSNKRKSTWNKHSKTRPGQQQGKARNAKRGEKNKKHQKKDNPNK